MPIFRVVWRFKQASSGWTETYYANASESDFAFPDTTFRQARLAFLTKAATLVNVSVILTTGNRQAAQETYDEPGNWEGASQADPLVAANSLLVRIDGAEGSYRHVEFRGLGKSAIFNNVSGQYPSGSLTALVQNWLDEAILDNYVIQVKDPSLIDTPWYNVSSVNKLTDGRVVVNAPETGLASGDIVYFRGYDKCVWPQFNGTVVVYSVAGDVLSMPFVIRDGQAVPYVPDHMQIREVNYLYRQFTDASILYLRTRDTGRPTGLLRGRQSSRSCRR